MIDASLLLDTCVFIDWAFQGPLSKRVQQLLDAAANEGRVYLSSVSVQETLRLAEKGRLRLDPTAHSWMRLALRRLCIEELPFTWKAAFEAGYLTDVNGDPSDRSILGAAIASGCTLLTRDSNLLEAAKRKGIKALDTR